MHELDIDQIEQNSSEQITWFDYDEVSRLCGEDTPEDARTIAADMFAAIMTWVWGGNGSVKSASIRLAAMTAGLRPDLLEDRTYSELAAELGCTKQAISRCALKFSDGFNMKFARSRSDDQRKTMSVSAKGHPNHNLGRNQATDPISK